MSQKTGLAPTWIIGSMLGNAVSDGTSTSSPGFNPCAICSRCTAAVQEDESTTHRALRARGCRAQLEEPIRENLRHLDIDHLDIVHLIAIAQALLLVDLKIESLE